MKAADPKRNLFLKSILSIIVVLIYSFNLLIMSSNRFFSFFNELNVGSIFIVIFIMMIGTLRIRIPKQIYFYVIMIAYYFISVMINHGGIMSAVQQTYIIIFVVTMYNCDFDRTSIIIATIANVIVWVMWIANSRQYGSIYLMSKKGVAFNSNTVSELLFFSYIVVILFSRLLPKNRKVVYTLKGNEIKHPHIFLQLVFLLITLWGLIQTQSRTSVIVFVLFNVLFFISPKVFNRKNVLIITGVILIGGLIFPIIYIALQSNYALINWVTKVTGKSLFTGREYTWMFLVRYLVSEKKALIFGLGQNSAIRLADFLMNVHNSYLAYLMFFGIIGLILFMIFILFLVNDICDGLETSCRDFCLSCIFATWVVLIILYTETIAVWPVFVIIPYFIMCIGGNKALQRTSL